VQNSKSGHSNAEPRPAKRHRIGSYGAGALWCVSDKKKVIILFKDTPIAQRSRKRTQAWVALDPAWKVTTIKDAEFWVERRGGDGVFVSLSGG
jgi:hypothetical protein